MKLMKYSLLTFCLFAFGTFAQQHFVSSAYWNNYAYYNPAMNGVDQKYEANVLWRNQQSGFQNTFWANYGMNLGDKHGIGFSYVHGDILLSGIDEFKANYNYQLNLDSDRKLVFGTALGIHKRAYNGKPIPPTWDPNPELFQTVNTLNIDLGVAYYGKQLVAGFGVTNLPLYRNSDSFYLMQDQYLFGNVRYYADLKGSSKLIFETQMRTDFVQYDQDFNLGFNWRDILEGRVGYRTTKEVIFNLTGIIAKHYRVGYSYDMRVDTANGNYRGAHEVTLGWRLPK